MMNNTFSANNKKIILGFLFASLIMTVASSMYYRGQRPSLQVKNQRVQQAGPMAQVGTLMEKLQAHPEDVQTMRELGSSFMNMGAWERASMFWRRILAVPGHENDIMALNQLGVCLFELQQYEQAAQSFTRIVEVKPDYYQAHYNLGMLYKHYLKQPDKAKQHFEILLELQPKDKKLVESVQKELQAGK